MPWPMASRLIRSLLAASGTALVTLIAYVIVDLYLSGHGRGWTPDRGNPWYYHLFTVLLILGPIGAGVVAFRRRD